MCFFDGKISVFYANGFISGCNPTFVYVLTVLYVVLVMSNMAFLPVPFLYRYYSVCRFAQVTKLPDR